MIRIENRTSDRPGEEPDCIFIVERHNSRVIKARSLSRSISFALQIDRRAPRELSYGCLDVIVARQRSKRKTKVKEEGGEEEGKKKKKNESNALSPEKRGGAFSCQQISSAISLMCRLILTRVRRTRRVRGRPSVRSLARSSARKRRTSITWHGSGYKMLSPRADSRYTAA